MNERTKIPTGPAEALLFESDMTCCICQVPSKPVQLHHLDRKANNHDPRNIAVLCLNHHNEATATPGLGRSLSAGVIRRYRDQWLKLVRARRKSPHESRSGLASSQITHEQLLDSLACHEVRKMRFALQGASWADQVKLLSALHAWTDWNYGNTVRSEILYTLQLVADHTRQKMPAAVAREIENLVLPTLPISSLVIRARKKPKESTIKLLRSALHLGSVLVYDGMLYLKNIAVTAQGTRILFIVLRFAHLNGLKTLKKEVLEEFKVLDETATRADFEDGRRWLEFEKLNALALRGDPFPVVPNEIVDKIDAKS